MKMDVAERLVTLSILPKEGNFTTLKILRELRMNLGFKADLYEMYMQTFTEEELKDWRIVSDLEAGTVNWETNGEAEIPIGEKATDIIIESLRKLDGELKLEEHMFDIYERFIPTT